MKSIGKRLKELRQKKKISVAKLSELTKIKSDFIRLIEEEKWDRLPEFPVVMGFVKNIAESLDKDPAMAGALLKRDYPPKSLPINPKPDVSKEFVWSPRFTFFVGIIIVVIFLLGYLVYQYFRFTSPPVLVVDEPTEGQIVNTSKLKISGNTDLEATVRVNNQPVNLSNDGKFTTEIEVVEETENVIVTARSRSGKETTISRKIEVDLDKED